MSANREPLAGKRLDSWKEIAAFLGRAERTVKRWETERGLPVHRVPGGGRSAVFAYSHELADWLKGRSEELDADDSAPGGVESRSSDSAEAAVLPAPATPAPVTAVTPAMVPTTRRKWPMARLAAWMVPLLLVAGLVTYFSVGQSGPRYKALASRQPANGEGHDLYLGPDSVAVLPFTNVRGDANTDYLSDGITESLIGNLAHVPQLKVRSRDSAFRYKGKDVDVRTIGSNLGVTAVVSGRVLLKGDTIEISAELTDIRDNTEVWGHHYTGKSANLVSLQQQIAGDIAGKLRSTLSSSERQKVTRQGTQNPEAYELYLKGRYAWNNRTYVELLAAISDFNQAIARDPGYAAAYSGLADAYAVLPNFGGNQNEDFPKSNAAARKALELDPTLAHPHAVLGSNEIQYDWDFAGGEAEFKKSFALDPNDATAHQWYADDMGMVGGREQEALAEVNRAHELDPESLVITRVVGGVLGSARKYDEAITICRKLADDNPTFAIAHDCLAYGYWGKRMYPQVIEQWKTYGQLTRNQDDYEFAAAMERGYRLAGWKGALAKAIEFRQEGRKARYSSALCIARFYADMGDNDQAFHWLDIAYREHDWLLLGLNTYFQFDAMRSDPRLPNFRTKSVCPSKLAHYLPGYSSLSLPLVFGPCFQLKRRKLMRVQNAWNYLLAGALVAATMGSPIAAQSTPSSSKVAAPATAAAEASGYNQPPKNILDVMRAPMPPVPRVSPTHDSILLVSWQEYPSITRVATPFLRLAGVRVEPRNHSKHDTPGGYGITPCATNFELVHVADGTQIHIALPTGACPGDPIWAADGKHFAFANIAAESVELWIGDAKTGEVHRVPSARLNPMFEDELQWMPDQKTLLVKLVPKGMGAPPPEPILPIGPTIQETEGEKGQSSTYENRDTLNNKHDEDLFDYYASSQLALVNVNAATATITPIGKPANYESLDPAPDGQHILVTAIHKPYSYVVTYERFPQEVEVWDVSHPAHVLSHTIASLPLADRVPIDGVPTGPREFSWRATEPATLVYADALDGGDWNVNVPARDKVLLLKAPFSSPAVEITKTEQRYVGFAWGEQPSVALITEYDNNRHWRKTFITNVDDPQQKPRLLWDLSTDERYANPGAPVRRQLPNGAWVVRQDGDSAYLAGVGSSPDGDRPFLDRLDLKTLKTERLFRSDKTCVERFLSFTGPDARTFLTWHQSPTDPPNAFTRTLGNGVDAPAGEAAFTSTTVALTHIPDPTPAVRAIKKRLVKYKRADGLDLSFTLYTPPGYVEGTRVPAILYAYPLDYASASTAGQVAGSQETFTQLFEYKLLLLGGYAIIDNAAFPIVGDPKKAYDTYLDQLVADAKAAVDEAVRLGVADPDRIGVTGHSHGALMTANLVAHSDLFRAGAATSGSYNKTLTPFGFQNERRSVWEAPDVYMKVSPFFFADKLKTPLLIMHGAEDANPGTTPLQAQKLYEAIRGNGGTARLVMLPHEPHWYTAMESNEQLVYEMLRWFDKYVKNAPPRAAGGTQ